MLVGCGQRASKCSGIGRAKAARYDLSVIGGWKSAFAPVPGHHLDHLGLG